MIRRVMKFGLLVSAAFMWPSEERPIDIDAATDEAVVVESSEPLGSDAGVDRDELSSRELYNQGLHEARLARFDEAEGSFLMARDRAGPDADVLYRSAFNIGHVLASKATSIEEETPERALEVLRASASWFGEAVRSALEGEEATAKQNLELVQRRISRLADKLNGEQTLADRLRRSIDDQRTVRDSIRGVLGDLAAEGDDPTAHASKFGAIATEERVLLADVADVLLLAAEERAELESLGDQRSQEEAVRAQQLLLLERYLSLAEQSLHDTRRRLRQHDAQVAHRLANNGLDELKRSLEQLLDPVAVLKLVLAAEERLLAETTIAASTEVPPWLTGDVLAVGQERAIVRTADITERFSYALENSSAQDGADGQAMLRLERAVPLLESAIEAMRNARENLLLDAWREAVQFEARSIDALKDALERFADVKTLIELTYAAHQEVKANLAERQVALPSAEKNQARLWRLRELLESEARQASTDPSGQSAADGAADSQAERTRLALELTDETRSSFTALIEALRIGADANYPHGQAEQTLQELRRLYFTIVEHLQELAHDQSETWDETAGIHASAIAEGSLGDVPELQRVVDRQNGHRNRADELETALVEMADQAANEGVADAPADDGENPFALAADDVRLAAGAMTSASDILGRETSKLAPADIEPVTENQREAIEHVLRAIARLNPPQGDDGDSGESDSGDSDAQDENDAQMTRRQALQRLQAIRDREAERRRQRGTARPEPVERDW